MADFTFDNDKPDGSTGTEAGSNNGGNAGSSSGETVNSNGASNAAGQSGGANGEASSFDPAAPYGRKDDGTPRKRRPGGGRKPSSATDATGASSTDKGAKDRLGIKNDRAKVEKNIAGLHAMAAVLTKQPIMNLKAEEATALTNSLCDVADYHNFDLMGAGGAFGMYASLATTAYMIYVPRFLLIKYNKAAEQARPVTPGEAREEATTRAGKMDFTSDVQH